MPTNLPAPLPTTTPPIDAATLRAWAEQAHAIAVRCNTGLGDKLYASIQLAALQAQRAEEQFDRDMEAEFERLFPDLDNGDVPEVLPVQPRADHEFGCGCRDCRE